jgi:hypothetical protein
MCELTLEQAGQFHPVKERHYQQYLKTLDWADFGQHDTVRRARYEEFIKGGLHPSEEEHKQPIRLVTGTEDYGKEF